MSEFYIALIGLLGSAIGAAAGILLNTKLIVYRLEQLEEKVSKHNSLIERTYDLEAHAKLLDEKIVVINHRVKDLEETSDKYSRVISDNKFMKEV